MANMSLKKNPMPSQEPDVRNKNFDEVALGYTEEMAIDEAKRCLNCKNPKCVNGCPVNVHIPEFIAKVAEGKFDEAFGVITSTNSLPAICGRVCPQENQCEGQCIRGIKGEPVGIGRLERFVADYHNTHGHQGGAPAVPESNGHKVAVVGSGPAGLTCAGDLARKGYDVTVFEALHQVGGVLVYGIPEFRLPKDIVQKEIDGLKALGVDVQTNMVIGRVLSIDELLEQGFEAVFIGSGAGLPAIPLRMAWQRGTCWLVEAREKRALFLSTVLARVPLPGTHVFRGRVEHFFPKQARKADCITSRAFMPWPQLLELVAPHLADDGIVVILAREEPPAAGDIDGWELVGSFAYTADNVHRWFWARRRRADG